MSLLKIKVISHASKDEVIGMLGDALKVRVRAPAEDGRANISVIEILAKHLKMEVKKIKIRSGFHSSIKIIEVAD